MQVELESAERLSFTDGSPVRAASAVARLGTGFLIAQDDATHAAWRRDTGVEPLRLFAPIDGHDVFDEASGTKDLKPDLEAACVVEVDGVPGVLLLGSGSSPLRMRSALVRLHAGEPHVATADLTPLYGVVGDALGVDADALNMEGACVIGDVLRWFHRGLPSAGLPSGSVDLELAAALAAAVGAGSAGDVAVSDVRSYDLGEVEGVGLAVTDAVALADGAVLVSAAAEDAPNARDDGPVVGAALVRIEDRDVTGHAVLPQLEGQVCKVEGLTLLEQDEAGVRVLGVVDADDPSAPSRAVRFRVTW